MKIILTQHGIEKQTCPAGQKRVYIYDRTMPGLALCVTSTGEKTFYLCRRINGRGARVLIGKFPGISVDAARKESARMLGELASGKDPQAVKRALRGEATFGELWENYLEKHAKIHKRSWAEDEGLHGRHLMPWANRTLSSITPELVESLHQKIGKACGQYTANRTLALISAMFSKRARALGFVGQNPARGVRRFREQSRERFLDGEEMPRFLAAVEAYPDPLIKDAIMLALWTGARRGNVFAARWEHIKFSGPTWTIPASESKNGKELKIHLAPPAVEILKRRWDDRIESPFVLASYGATGHIASIKKAWEQVLKSAGITGLRFHDLRRSLGSWQAAAGASLSVIGKSLGHQNTATTAIYARLNLDPVRVSVDSAVAAMQATKNAKPAAPVATVKAAG